MKKLLSTLAAIAVVFAAGAQITLPGFVFPEYQSGTVYYKNGTTSNGQFNYDGLMQKMSFNQNGTPAYLANAADVEKMVIGDHTFVPVGNDAFYEEFTAGNGKFYVNHKKIMKDAEANTGFMGIGTSNMAVETPDLVSIAGTNTIPSARLSLNAAYIDNKQEVYLFSDGRYRVFSNANQLSNVYGYKKEISDFAKQNKIDFKNPEDLKKIVEYAASL